MMKYYGMASDCQDEAINMYVCVYVSMYACMYVCRMYVCVYICMDGWMDGCSDLYYIGHTTIHINLPFTRSREPKDVEILGTEIQLIMILY